MILPFIAGYEIENPDFAADTVRFLALEVDPDSVAVTAREVDVTSPLSPDEVEGGDLPLSERLVVLIDRLEFIEHLAVVSAHAQESDFVLAGHEVRGVHWDISALRVYLSLTCIDMFMRRGDQHRAYFERTFAAATPALLDGLKLVTSNGIGTAEELGNYLYNVRNYYTHAGRRFHVKEDATVAQLREFMAGSHKRKVSQSLFVLPGTDLVATILAVAAQNARRRFGWETEA